MFNALQNKRFQITFIKGRIGYIGKFTDKGNINGLGVKLKTNELVGGIMYGNRNYTWISGKFVHAWFLTTTHVPLRSTPSSLTQSTMPLL